MIGINSNSYWIINMLFSSTVKWLLLMLLKESSVRQQL